MASRPGSEAAHEAHIAKLAGDAAGFLATAPKKYPNLVPEVLECMTAEGFQCLVSDTARRIVIYRHGEQMHAIVTNNDGYRRSYSKHSTSTAQELVAVLSS